MALRSHPPSKIEPIPMDGPNLDDSNFDSLLQAFDAEDPLRKRVESVLRALPCDVIEDFLADPKLHIHPIDRKATQSQRRTLVSEQSSSLAFLTLPGKDGRSSRCITLKRKLASDPLVFCYYVIAHELAHAHLHNGRWGEILDREEAADALAAEWGFVKPKSKKWFSLR